MKKIFAISILLSMAVLLFALTETETWAGTEWNTPWTFVADVGACDSTNTWDYSATGGNPDNCRIRVCIGKNDNAIEGHIEWTGTWEDLGVPSGNTVSTVQMTDVDTIAHAYSVCDQLDIGEFTLRNSSDVLVATMWAGRTPSGQEGSWTSEGSQSAQSVGGLTAGNSSIELWFQGFHNTGNNAAAECSFKIDNLDISIEHTATSGATQHRIFVTWKQGENGFVRASD